MLQPGQMGLAHFEQEAGWTGDLEFEVAQQKYVAEMAMEVQLSGHNALWRGFNSQKYGMYSQWITGSIWYRCLEIC